MHPAMRLRGPDSTILSLSISPKSLHGVCLASGGGLNSPSGAWACCLGAKCSWLSSFRIGLKESAGSPPNHHHTPPPPTPADSQHASLSPLQMSLRPISLIKLAFKWGGSPLVNTQLRPSVIAGWALAKRSSHTTLSFLCPPPYPLLETDNQKDRQKERKGVLPRTGNQRQSGGRN